MQSNDYDNVNILDLKLSNTQKIIIHEKENWNSNNIEYKLIYFLHIDTIMLLNIYLTIYIIRICNNYVYFMRIILNLFSIKYIDFFIYFI